MKAFSLNRRSFLAGTGGVLALGAKAFAKGESGTLTIASYGGIYQEAQNAALVAPFQKANPGIEILHDTTVSDAKVRTMVESGQVTWDIVVLSDNLGFDDDGKWLEPIDFTVVPRDRFPDAFVTKHRVGAAIEAAVITYRKDVFKDKAPTSFAGFFDLKTFPGKRAVYKFVASGIIEGALIADGVDLSKLYPIDMDRALRKLDSIKSEIIWWETGAQSTQLMASGEAAMGLLWIGRAMDAVRQAPVAAVWDQWIPTNAYWGIPKGAPNKALAMKAIEAFTAEEPQKHFSQLIPYGPSNKNVKLESTSTFAGNYPTDHLNTAVPMDYRWWRDNRVAVDRRFQQWLIS